MPAKFRKGGSARPAPRSSAPRRGPRGEQDASAFLKDVDLASLPPNAAICSTWRESTALWYAKFVQTRRLDVLVLNTSPTRWVDMIERYPDRPHFAIANIPELEAYRPTLVRNHLWRLHRPGPSGADARRDGGSGVR